MIIRDYWETAVEYYDQFYSGRTEDVEFWTGVANRFGGPVLEIGCGTGRVGLELARNGHELCAIDRSEAVLQVFRQKLASEPQEVRRLVHLQTADMRNFELGREFRLALMPFRPFQHMLTLEDQLAALAHIRRHLPVGGILAFDVFFPKFSVFDEPDGIEKLEREWLDNEGRTIQRFFVRHRVDRINQVIYGSFIFRIYNGPELVREARSRLDMSYYTYPHLRLLLQLSGFEVIEEFGSFSGEPITVHQELILVARAV